MQLGPFQSTRSLVLHESQCIQGAILTSCPGLSFAPALGTRLVVTALGETNEMRNIIMNMYMYM